MKFTNVLNAFKNIKGEVVNKNANNKSISDYLLWLYKDRNLTFSALKESYEQSREENLKTINKFFASDFNKLGAELHAANYTLKMNGRCRLHGSPRWIELPEHKISQIKSVLPQDKNARVFVEALDLSKTVIQYDGFSNLEHCSNLKTLILNDCIFVDDFFLAKVSSSYYNTLENLQIANCPLVTEIGLQRLGYLNKLKNLRLKNLKSAKNVEYISILLEDYIQGLEVDGVDHLSKDSFDRVSNNLSEEEKNLKAKLDQAESPITGSEQK